MELLNFLLLLNFVYFFYYSSLLTKMTTFFLTSMLISIIKERENLRLSNNYLAILITYFLDFSSYLINLVFCSYLFNILVDCLEKLNYYFVLGKNELIKYLIANVKKVLPRDENKINIKKIDNKNVFENDDQMMNFLDNLDDKKKN